MIKDTIEAIKAAVNEQLNDSTVLQDVQNIHVRYLGKKGNSFLENVGYGLGAMANLADLGETGKLLLNTEKKDIINHSAILDENRNVIISEGPGKNWIEPKGSVDHYLNRTLGGSGATNRYPVLGENVTINKVNLTAIKTYGKVLDFLTKKQAWRYYKIRQADKCSAWEMSKIWPKNYNISAILVRKT